MLDGTGSIKSLVLQSLSHIFYEEWKYFQKSNATALILQIKILLPVVPELVSIFFVTRGIYH
jgi:hypothetical protein